ncbi:presequence protease, mitochondrial [Trichonephila clavipes]|nr:presequence protease, mitochondrial [Trichonephila clavipes]
MQISGVHPEDELDFSHILHSQVKNVLTRITSLYKPEKTESTDVTRRIILNNDIPVYQPACRLSYVEKKSVNKRIEEWLEQGIVRPNSSEYASPIVFVKNKKTYNKKRKKAPEYQVGDLVGVQRIQFGGGLKLRPKFFGEVKPRDRYTVEKVTFLKQLAEMENHEYLLEKFKKLANVLFSRAPMRCSLNATPDFMPLALNSLDSFLSEINFSNTSRKHKSEMTLTEAKSQNTHFVLPFNVNYLGQSILTVPYCHPDYSNLKIAAKLMSSKFLHSEIREKGGAYGGGASINKGGHFMFYSYRDPNVTKTLKAFSSGIDWLLERSYSDCNINEAKLGVFSEKIPRSICPLAIY